MKTYEVTYAFGDVIRTINAKDKEDAERKAQDLLENEFNDIHNDSECHLIEVE